MYRMQKSLSRLWTTFMEVSITIIHIVIIYMVNNYIKTSHKPPITWIYGEFLDVLQVKFFYKHIDYVNRTESCTSKIKIYICRTDKTIDNKNSCFHSNLQLHLIESSKQLQSVIQHKKVIFHTLFTSYIQFVPQKVIGILKRCWIHLQLLWSSPNSVELFVGFPFV